ncbi:hypothetical protein HYT17_03730, partial [Candidatus Microgenomates bacterium]|nr:hypothetical protein [Candidatus Microgenomates bacterium]
FVNKEYLGSLIFSNYQKIITPTATTTRADVMANPDGSDQPTRPFNISIIREIEQPEEIRIGLGTIDNPSWESADLSALSHGELRKKAETIFNLPEDMAWTSSLESPNKVAGTGQDRQGRRFSVTLGNNGTGALTITFDN